MSDNDCACSRGGNASTCEHNDVNTSWLDEPGDAIICGNQYNAGCGASYTVEEFDKLPHQRVGNGLVYADCACGSTLCREATTEDK